MTLQGHHSRFSQCLCTRFPEPPACRSLLLMPHDVFISYSGLDKPALMPHAWQWKPPEFVAGLHRAT